MKKYLLFLIITFIVFGAQAQIDTIARSFSTTITAYDLKDNLTYIASPSTEGRETGTPGLVRAAEYIASKFGLIGIQQMGGTGTYYQSYKYIRSKSRDVTLFDSLQRYEYLKDFYVQADVRNGLVYKKQVVFMGYGIDAPGFNDYANDTNLTDKIVVLFNDEPYHKGKSLITGNISHSDWYHNTTLKLNRISKYKPAAVIFIDDAFYGKSNEIKRNLVNDATPMLVQSIYEVSFPILYTNLTVASKLLGTDSMKLSRIAKKTTKKHKPIHFASKNRFSIELDRISSVPTSDNVIGYVEGSDLKDEFVVISAHYDHLGMHKGKIYYGADDDGSGTAALIEIAEAFAIAKSAGNGPRRSILFCAFSGEEKGLLGSNFYVSNPRVPLEKTVLDLNIDMIGRVDSTYSALQNPNYVYPIGSTKHSSELKQLLEKCNDDYTKLKLDFKFDVEDKNKFYSRSDHYNFAKNGVPVIFFFTGLHADYHKSTDTIEKINFEKMETIARLVFQVAWKTANQTERLKLDIQ